MYPKRMCSTTKQRSLASTDDALTVQASEGSEASGMHKTFLADIMTSYNKYHKSKDATLIKSVYD